MRNQTENVELNYQLNSEELRCKELSEFRYNILPVKFSTDPSVIYFKESGSDSDHRISIGKLPDFIRSHFKTGTNGPDRLYMCFQPESATVSFTLNLTDYPNIARAYYTYRIRNYFASVTGAIIQSNFLQDSCFWFLNPALSTGEYHVYKKILVRLQYSKSDSQPTLLLAYSGMARVLKTNFSALNGSRELFEALTGKVVFRNEVYTLSKLPESAKYHPEEIYPVLNSRLSASLKIMMPYKPVKNKHEVMVEEIKSFMRIYLNNDQFKALLAHDGVFRSVKPADQMNILKNSNRLVFGENQCSENIIQGMKDFGPCKFPDARKIVYFFIYSYRDLDPIEKIYKYFKENSQVSNRLNQFISMPFFPDKNMNIVFDPATDTVESIIEKVSGFRLETGNLYYAFYISQFGSQESDLKKWTLYHEIKEILLERGIPIQVLDRNKLLHGNINYFIPNIAIAMIGKLGGIPWRLNKPLNNELIVGFGAFRSDKFNIRYVGASFCFRNDGVFQKFDCFRASDTVSLAGMVEEALIGYSKINNSITRIVIHFYKELNKTESWQLEKVLRNLNLNVPVFIVSVNKTRSQDTIAFLSNSAVSMPVSGSIFQYGHSSYLLYINDRKSYDQKSIGSMPAPLKIKLSSSDPEMLKDRKVVISLMQQVYDFCFMYWRSCRHSTLPVTMAYPEMVAGMVPWFKSKQIPLAANGKLWFL